MQKHVQPDLLTASVEDFICLPHDQNDECMYVNGSINMQCCHLVCKLVGGAHVNC